VLWYGREETTLLVTLSFFCTDEFAKENWKFLRRSPMTKTKTWAFNYNEPCENMLGSIFHNSITFYIHSCFKWLSSALTHSKFNFEKVSFNLAMNIIWQPTYKTSFFLSHFGWVPWQIENSQHPAGYING